MKKRITVVILFFMILVSMVYAKGKTKTDEEKAAELAEHMEKYNGYDDSELLLIIDHTEPGEQHDLAQEIYNNRQKIKALEEEIRELNDYLNSVETGTEENPEDIGEKKAELEAKKRELHARVDAKQQLTYGTITSINDYLASEYSITPGDPVKITTGSYIQSETDIQSPNFDFLKVIRNYDSNSFIVSTFGLGWATNLDQRIILGIEPLAHEIYEAELRYDEALKAEIDQIERNLIRIYKIPNLQKGKAVLEKRISDCRPHEEDFKKFQSDAKGFESFENKADSLYSAYRKKLLRLRNDLNEFNAGMKTLEEKKAAYEQRIAETQRYYNEVVLKSDTRKEKNKIVIFPGMDTAEYTGLDTLTVIDENGYSHILYETQNESGVWKGQNETLISECRTSAQGYRVIFYDGTINEYDENGLITKIIDRNSNSVEINRSSDGKISRISDSNGESYIVNYIGNYIEKIQNERFNTFTISYTYDRNKLKTVTDEDGDTVTMDYDDNGRMCALKKCDDSVIVFTYGEVTRDGKCLATKTKNEEEFEEHFEYDRDGKKAVYTDHDGNKTIYEYDNKHRTVKEIRADGTIIVNGYTGDGGNPASVTENGDTTYYSYDDRGNKLSARYSNNSTELWTYNEFNQITSYTDRDGVIYEYFRDENGNLVEYRVGGKRVYSHKINEKGQVIQRTVYGQNAVTTDYVYDEYGNLKTETCDGVVTLYEYDSRNRVEKVTLDEEKIKEYIYNGHTVVQKDYNGLETTYVSNDRKDMTDVIQKDTLMGTVHKTRIEYDRRHLPLKIYAGDGVNETLVSSYLYTPEGKIKAQTSHGERENWVTVYDYEHGEVSEVKQFKVIREEGLTVTLNDLSNLLSEAGEEVLVQKYNRQILNGKGMILTVTDGLNHQTFFEYDRYGNLYKTTDGNNETRFVSYTKAGRMDGEQSSHGGWYSYIYENGRLKKAGEENGEKAESTYFADGSIESVKDRYGKFTYYNYDSRGRVESVISENQKIWYEYDNFDRVIKQINGDSQDESSAVYYVTYDYSDKGRKVTVTEGGKYKSVSELDAFGNVIKQTDGNGNIRRYEYDSQNQLAKSYDGYEEVTTYEYNALGKIRTVTAPGGEKTEYKYNYMGLLEKVNDECGTVYIASYDKAGRLVKEKSRADSEKVYEYDDGGRIKKVLCGGEVIELYNYGPDSRSITVKDGNGESYVYNYNAYGRLTDEVNRNGLTQIYSYDADGQMDGQTNFDGSTTTIVYSPDRTVRTVRYSDGSENRFVYDSIGNIMEAQNAYGKTEYRYDKGGRMIYQKDVTTGEEVYFEYDGSGNRTRLYSSNRETVYTYGKNSEVKEIFDNKQRLSVKLDYDKNGREVLRKFGNGIAETTLYDKAGRAVVKAQKSERGELQWAEGYLYGIDGKRTATVDNKGKVTLYEYNKKGQLETVWYPYSQVMINTLKEEAETNGLPVTSELGENKYLDSVTYEKLVQLMNSMQYGVAGSLTNLNVFIKESYGYDRNGNRASKKTRFGTIEYSYDKENCLLSSGSRGQNFVTYSYDNMGNLLTEESALKSTKYAYNAQNRLIYCEVTDRKNKEYSQTTYAYDAFGRRIIVQDKGEAALRTLYDGLSFEVIKQSSTFANGMFTDSNNTGIQWGKTGKPTGDRYRYISEEKAREENRYFYLEDGKYKTTTSRYTGERTQISVNGTLAAQGTAEGTQYFTTDLFGSVSSVTDNYGYKLGEYTYDVFGSLVQGDLSGETDFGYLGKQKDSTSKLYNYGYRDYAPQSARFTTVDPIRDGTNWFAYVNNDPVNFVDLWGLAYRDRYGTWRSYTDKTYKLEAAMNNHKDDKYKSPKDGNPGESTYQCDDYDQTILRESELYKDSYFAGDSQQYNVASHIKNAEKNGISRNEKEKAPTLTKGEAYIVFMSDSPYKYQDHTGILRKAEDGKIYFSHNSSGNSTGGVSTMVFNNETDFQEWYDYDSFYYEKIKTK